MATTRKQRFVPSLENLETREVPASMTLNNGVLNIQGDDWHNITSIDKQDLGVDQYLVGDWDGNGKDELAVRRGNQIFYQSGIGSTATAGVVAFGNGNSEDQYLVGDWDGNGKDELAVRRGYQILYQGKLTDSRHAGTASYGNGNSESQYLVGDWDGNGKDELAVRRGNQILYQGRLSDTRNAGTASYGNGVTENQYLVGDWDGNGKDELAVRRGNQILYQGKLSDTRNAGTASYGNGATENQYLVGDWNGNGKDELAVRRDDRTFYQGKIADQVAAGQVVFGNGNRQNFDVIVTMESYPVTGTIFVAPREVKRFDGLAIREITFQGAGGDDICRNNTSISSTLYGGNGNDELYGGSGNDGLYGGADNDVLYGNGGSDRFLVMTGSKEAKDIKTEDAVIYFNTGTKGWSAVEIERVDAGLKVIHQETGNDNLLETQNGTAITFVRSASNPDGDLATNHRTGEVSTGNITMYDNAFASASLAAITAVHELGHNWDFEHSTWGNWIKLSDWKEDSKGNWSTKKADSHFALNSGKANPREDWATAWESYFTYKYGLADGQSLRKLPQAKTDHLTAFFNSQK